MSETVLEVCERSFVDLGPDLIRLRRGLKIFRSAWLTVAQCRNFWISRVVLHVVGGICNKKKRLRTYRMHGLGHWQFKPLLSGHVELV